MGIYKIERIGDALAIRLDPAELERLGLSEGDEVRVAREGVEGNAAEKDQHERAMKFAREGMDRYRHALAELAK